MTNETLYTANEIRNAYASFTSELKSIKVFKRINVEMNKELNGEVAQYSWEEINDYCKSKSFGLNLILKLRKSLRK